MTQLCLRVPDKLGEALALMAKQQDRSKSYIATQAIRAYLEELVEDELDYKAALEAEKSNEGSVSWEQVAQELGLR
jgi:predicted transcriptional regulator